MSSSTVTSVNISNSKIDELTSAKKSKKSKKKSVVSVTPTPPPSQTSNPFSTCGPLQFENEFLQFYAELHRSAVLFSDPKYQQEILFPNLATATKSQATKLNNLNVPSPNAASPLSPTSSFTKKQRNVKKAQRRLSGHAAAAGREFSSAGSNTGSGSGGSSGSMKHLKSDFEQFVKTIAASTPLPQQSKLKSLQKNSKGKIPGLKRKVSFSKNSPRMRSRSNSNQQSPSIRGENNIPWISIQEHCCWSSDMDETDTTETEDNASSTLGEGDDVVFTGRLDNEKVDNLDGRQLDLENQFNGLSTENVEAQEDLILNDN